MAKLSKGMLGLLGEIASLINGAIASGLKLVNNLVSSGFRMAFQFNESAMAFSRQAGLTAKQAQAYTEVLSTRAKDLGEKYGIAAEEVTKLEKNLAKATGRVIMLSNAQADMQIAINRTVGEQTADQFSQTMMRTMGAQFKTVQGAVSKAYALAAKSGLDAAGMAAKVAQNLGMANRLQFKEGVNGLTRMVALSEKLGFNLASMESAANKFIDLQDAIENSAKLTMLGGPMGALGGNPLDMAYEANYSMEDFTERITKMASGLAYFDEATGMARSNGLARDFARQLANTLGVSMDEVMTIANKQAEIKYKNEVFGRDLDRLTGGDEKMRDFFLNKAQYNTETKSLELTDRSGKARDISYFVENRQGQEELKEMMRFNNMSDEEIVREQAEAVVSIRERLEGYFTSIQGIFAEKITPFIQPMQKFLGDVYRIVVPHLSQIADNVKELLVTLFTPENLGKVKDGITTLIKGLTWLGKVLTSNWKWLIAGTLLTPVISVLTWGFNMLAMFKGGGGGAGAPAGAAQPGFFKTLSNVWKYDRGAGGLGRFAAGKHALASAIRANPAAAAGIGLGVGLLGTGMRTFADDEGIEKGNAGDIALSIGGNVLQKAGSLGGLGAGIGGPWGAAIGATVGLVWGLYDGIKNVSEIQNRKAKQVEGALNRYDERNKGHNSYAAGESERIYDSGVNMPPVGANSVVKDETWAVANRQLLPGHERVQMEYGERGLTKGEGEAVNEFIRAKAYDGATHIYVVNQNGGNSSGGSTQPTNSTITFNGTVRIEGGNTHKDYDINELIDNKEFIRRLFSRPEVTDAIRYAMDTNFNMKKNNDPSWTAGLATSSSLFGKLNNRIV